MTTFENVRVERADEAERDIQPIPSVDRIEIKSADGTFYIITPGLDGGLVIGKQGKVRSPGGSNITLKPQYSNTVQVI